MGGFAVSFIVGIICIVIGIKNMKGDISSLHSYHKNRVKEEDVLPFGRLVGMGTIIVGAAVMLFSALSALAVALGNDVYTVIGTVVMIVGIVAGLGVAFYGMKKYNGGIM
ncbi:MAG: hypothetical protein IKW53_02765 [Clostridia bacterium]|nr:hypothetical protein [Clostridia bacterium]